MDSFHKDFMTFWILGLFNGETKNLHVSLKYFNYVVSIYPFKSLEL